MKNYEQNLIPETPPLNNLNEKDIRLIEEQCEIQGATSKEQIEGFKRAYSTAKDIASNSEKLKILVSIEKIYQLIFDLGSYIEQRNKKGFRDTPVTFSNLETAIDHKNIDRAIKSFCEAFVSFLNNPVEDDRLNTTILYKEFEEIHPFEDGNGRVGDLLWKILETKKTGKWPEQLPPNIFNEKREK